ncbi:hypothetical protein GIB67_020832 [Kingdonia uniflora]|uniref:Uncharacterized protein n=1 Tax=Kingdonia uniflora TaxID=39325 RepID=A0A7J7M792_9MAGN|nr:hypothetical protein GIB67_020832 [Kingdonia uniflora]
MIQNHLVEQHGSTRLEHSNANKPETHYGAREQAPLGKLPSLSEQSSVLYNYGTNCGQATTQLGEARFMSRNNEKLCPRRLPDDITVCKLGTQTMSSSLLRAASTSAFDIRLRNVSVCPTQDNQNEQLALQAFTTVLGSSVWSNYGSGDDNCQIAIHPFLKAYPRAPLKTMVTNGCPMISLLLQCRFEKLQEDAFTYAFILKALDMVPEQD